MDCNKALRQADELGYLSNTLMDERVRLESLLARIKNEWCGPASSEFQLRLQKLIEDVDLARCHLLDVAYTIVQIVRDAQTDTTFA